VKISVIPWEIIWLLCLFLFIVTFFWTAVTQLKDRKFGFPRSAFFYTLLILLILIPIGLQVTDHRFILTENSLESTLISHELPDLRVRQYDDYTVQEIYQASIAAVQATKSYAQPWRIKFAELEEDQAGRIVVQVPVLWFTDELNITVERKGDLSGILVRLFSQSEARDRDYGENARHIKQFYEALEVELARQP